MVRNDYKRYKASSSNPVNEAEYSAIFSGYTQFLVDKVLSGDEVLLPNRFGSLHIKGVKPQRTLDGTVNHPINWPETIKLWNKYPDKKKDKVTVKHLNLHTDGYTYSFRWGKKGAFAKNKTVYHFRVTRCNRKLLSDKIKSGQEYLNRN